MRPYVEIGGLISRILRDLNLETRVKEQTALLAWDEVVGEQLANVTQPEFIREGRLFVCTRSPVWSNELTFHKPEIIRKLNSRLRGRIVKEIIFKVGPIEKRKPSDKPTDDLEIEGIQLTDLELERLEAEASKAGEGSDALKALLATALRLEKWKLANGWVACGQCGVLQNTGMDKCPICRMTLDTGY